MNRWPRGINCCFDISNWAVRYWNFLENHTLMILRAHVFYSATSTQYVHYNICIHIYRNREAKVKTACPRCFIILKCLVVPYSRRPTVGVNSRYFLNVTTAISVYPFIIPLRYTYAAEAYKEYHVPLSEKVIWL